MNLNLVKKYPSIRCFTQHGFDPEGETSNQVYGRCPFCGKEKHFYVNPELKAWKCHHGSCGRQGGFQSFLDEAFKLSLEGDNSQVLASLAQNRGLSEKTLEHFEVGYNQWTDSYVIPIKNQTADKIWDLRLYKNGRLLSTSGCNVGLLSWWELQRDYGIVYICEGEWDGMALHEAFQKASVTDALVAVPGAGTFKADWLASFKGKDVRVLYDNDEAGQKGALKVYNLLKSSANKLEFLHWPEGTGDGFDIRDAYKRDGAKKLLKFIEGNLRTEPPGVPDDSPILVKDTKQAIAQQVQKLDGFGTPPEEVYSTYRKWLHLPDELIIDFIFGTVIANRLPGDPLWAQVVGPSGATKTELLQSLSGAPMIATCSTMTPQALISGANFSGAGDPSLIPKWNGKVVIFKDMTTLMQMNKVHQDEVFSYLREIYDGHIEKPFGNGVYRSYDSKFGLVCGVTPVIEIFSEKHTSLGERFIRFGVEVPTSLKGRLEFSRRASDNEGLEDPMRLELKAIAHQVLNHQFREDAITIPPNIQEKILHLSEFLAKLRSTIERDNFTKDIMYKPFTEMSTRLSKQFKKLLKGVCAFRHISTADDRAYQVIKRSVLGTIPSRLDNIIHSMWRKDPRANFPLDVIASSTRLPNITTQRLLDGLTILDMVDRRVSGVKPEWKLSKEALELIETTELYRRK